MKIALLGPKGTFSENITKELYPQAKLTLCENIRPVLENLENGNVDLALIPIKNSVSGINRSIISCLKDFKVYIHEMHSYKIQLCLAGYMELCEAKRLYAQPHSYKQCKQTLKKFKFQGDLILAKTNAEAALMVQKDDQGVAITSKEAAEHFNLALMAEGVQDAKNNKTQFVLLSKEKPSLDLPRRDLYLYPTKDDTEKVNDMIKKVLKDSFTLENISSDEMERNLFLVSIDLLNKSHLVQPQKFFSDMQFLGSYAL